MCGICGVLYKDTQQKVAIDWLADINRTMNHRGPDDEGYFVEGNIGLGHRRLSIIDLAGGHQPIFNEDKSAVIILNGEIYNYKDLTEELKNKGHIFSTRSDTEVIIHAYEEYGPDCVRKLRGMYAFAIWDKKTKTLMIARDRVGKKPLYYYQDDDVFIFASEIKAILKSGFAKRAVNTRRLDFYLSQGYVPGAETLFEGINKLEPAHYMTINERGRLSISEYWDIDKIETNDYSFSDALDKLKHLLFESIEIRLMSEVPLGVFLSGGLDSSTIIALMSKLLNKPVKTFSVGYPDDKECSELGYASMIASAFKTEHHEFYLTPDDLFESIDTLLEHTEEPIDESAGIALYKLAKLAKPQATVLLSGEGGDELFAGYPIYPKMKTMERLRKITSILPSPVLEKIASCVDGTEKNQKYLEWISQPFEKRFRSLSYDMAAKTKEKMYTDNFKKNLNGEMEEYYFNLHRKCTHKSLLGRMLYIDTKTWLPDNLLVKADKMTMAASVELRAPFLDHKLLEFATSLQDSYKLYGKVGKHILREFMKDKIPQQIINRKKMGFPVPLTSWFRGKLFQRSQDLLLSERALERGYFKKEYIAGLFKKIKNKEDLGRRIFSLVTLELWQRKYID